MKKRIASIVMLVVLVVGIALAAYGVTGRNIYSNAANMLGVSQKDAMSYIQDPSTLTEIGDMGKIGADKVKGFLKGLGLDAATVDSAVDARVNYEEAVAKSKDREAFLEYAKRVDETVTDDNFNELVMDHDRSDRCAPRWPLRRWARIRRPSTPSPATRRCWACTARGFPSCLKTST